MSGRLTVAIALATSALLGATSCSWFDKEPAGPATQVRERWMQPQPGIGLSRPVVVGDLVVFSAGGGELIARRLATGEAVWQVQVSPTEPIAGAHLLESTGVVVAAARHSVHGVDAATGAVLWNYTTPVDSVDDVNPRPGLVDGARLDADAATVYVPAWGASVSALDLRTGAVRWVWRPPAGTPNRTGSMGVRVSGDTVLATVWHFLNSTGTQSESWLVALDGGTGRQLWALVLPAPGYLVDIECAPAIWGRLALVNTGNGQLFAVDRFTRAIVWQTPVADTQGQGLLQTTASPAVEGDVVYHDAGTAELIARNTADGRLLWKVPASAEFVADLTVTPRRVTGTTYGYMRVFDRASGRLVAEFQQPRTGDPLIASAPAVAGRQLFVGVNGAAWSFDEP